MAPVSWHFNSVLFDYSPFVSALICFLIAIVYVGSLYIWTPKKYDRDHPTTIKLRFIRVGVVCLLMFPFLWLCSTKSHSIKARPMYVWIGMRVQGLITATILPLLLTMILFAGPLALRYVDGVFRLYKDPQYWMSNMSNLIWMRNHVVAPITEELTFRACMLPFLVPSLGENCSVFVAPLFFGVAHFHHMVEKIKTGVEVKSAVLQACVQFGYTTLFGAYSAFLFLRTNHLMAPVIVHAFCNHMGFPDLQEVLAHPQPRRTHLILAYVVGLLAWVLLLYPLTSPWLYANTFYEL